MYRFTSAQQRIVCWLVVILAARCSKLQKMGTPTPTLQPIHPVHVSHCLHLIKPKHRSCCSITRSYSRCRLLFTCQTPCRMQTSKEWLQHVCVSRISPHSTSILRLWHIMLHKIL